MIVTMPVAVAAKQGEGAGAQGALAKTMGHVRGPSDMTGEDAGARSRMLGPLGLWVLAQAAKGPPVSGQPSTSRAMKDFSRSIA